MIPTTSYTPTLNRPLTQPAITPPVHLPRGKRNRQAVLYIRAEQHPYRQPAVHIIRSGKRVVRTYHPSQASIMRLQTLMRYYIIIDAWSLMPHLSPHIGWTATLRLALPGGAK